MSTPIPVANPGTDDWYAARSTGIGASEAAAACGLSPYESAYELYLRKRGEIPAIEETPAMRMGKRLEPAVVDEFCFLTGLKLEQYPVPMFRHHDLPHILATPDAVLRDNEGLECKTTRSQVVGVWASTGEMGEVGTDECPTTWVMQCQQQMLVCGFDVVWIACLVDGRDLLHFRIEKEPAIHDALRNMEAELWGRIQSGDAPQPDFSHPSIGKLVKEIYRGVEPGKVVHLSEEAAQAWEMKEAYADEKKVAAKLEDEQKNRVLAEMKTAELGVFPGGEIELKRTTVAEKEVPAYTRKSYDIVRARKVKA